MNETREALGTVCIVHAGTEKTGSTSLQRFLALNADALARQNIWVPRCLAPNPVQGPYNHTLLVTASRLSIKKPDDLQVARGLTTMEDVARHRQEIVQALALEYAGLGFTPSKIIVSSEHIHSRLKKHEDLENAKELLRPFSSNFQVFVYLREQADLVQSLAVTSVRDGATEFRQIPDFSTPNGFDPFLGVDFNYFDYGSLLERLAAVFGETVLRARLYERAELHNGSVIDDFFAGIGLDIRGTTLPERENPGLNRVATLFLAAFNQHAPRDENFVPVRARLIDYLNASCAGTIPLGRHEAREVFMRQFFAGNEAVREKYFPRRVALFPPILDGSVGGDGVAPLSMQEIFGMFVDVLAQS